MAKQLNLLDPNTIKNHKLKPDKDEEWLRDGGNLFCRVKRPEETNKVFFYRGRYNGSPIKLSLGSFPQVTLKYARQLRNQCWDAIREGIHPKDYFESQKEVNISASSDGMRFGNLLEDLIEHNTTLTDKKWSVHNIKRYRGIWKNYLGQHLADKSIMNISDTQLLDIFKRIKTNPVKLVSGKKDKEKYNRTTTAIFAKTLINMIYNYAKEEKGYKGDNMIDPIRNNSIFKKGEVKNHKGIREEDLGRYWNGLKQLKNYQDTVILFIYSITALRVNSLTNSRWSWFDASKRVLNIPAEFMKRRKDFITPLPQFLVEHLVQLKAMRRAGKDDYIFINSKGNKYDNNRPRLLVKEYLGFDYATAHGARNVLKVHCERSGKFNSLAIKAQMHHENTNKVEAAYMQDYDWLKERFELVDYMVEFLNQHEKNYLSIKNIGQSTLA